MSPSQPWLLRLDPLSYPAFICPWHRLCGLGFFVFILFRFWLFFLFPCICLHLEFPFLRNDWRTHVHSIIPSHCSFSNNSFQAASALKWAVPQGCSLVSYFISTYLLIEFKFYRQSCIILDGTHELHHHPYISNVFAMMEVGFKISSCLQLPSSLM